MPDDRHRRRRDLERQALDRSERRVSELVEAFADSSRRNRAIVDPVGAINASDLRLVRAAVRLAE